MDQNCTTFSTHYISIKRRDDESFRKIVIGLRAIRDGEDERKYGSFIHFDAPQMMEEYEPGVEKGGKMENTPNNQPIQ